MYWKSKIGIIREAANKLNNGFKTAHPEFPIRVATTMRNKLIHDYNMVDHQLIWDTVKKGIPELKKLCEKLLHSRP